MANPVIKFTGLNNRLRPGDERGGKLWKASNCQFTNDNSVLLPRQGTTLVKSGDSHSVFKSHVGVLYVSSGNLYKVGQVSPLLSTIGSNPVRYVLVGDTVYFTNGTVTGRYVKGESTTREWGTPTPSNPTVTAISSGGMYAGDYRVVITWIGDFESGAGNSVSVTVQDGGGIRLTSFPSAPAYVTKFAVWCSPVNGEKLFLYGEYDIATTQVDIERHDSSILLNTQFAIPPAPTGPLCYHSGQIFYADGPLLRYTHIGEYGPNYGLETAFNYLPFDATDIQVIVSVPGMLYVGTEESLYQVLNLNSEESPILNTLQGTGAIKYSECYDSDGNPYFMSGRGFIKATPEGLQELSFADVAIPSYNYGYSTVTDIDGIRSLLFFGVNPVANPLAHSDWDVLPNAWAINLETGAVSYYESVAFNNIHNGYLSDSTGIRMFDAVYSGTGSIQTGKLDLGIPSEKRISDAILDIEGGVNLTAATKNSTVLYTVRTTNSQEHVKQDLARGAKGHFWQFTLANKSGSTAIVRLMELVAQPIRRH